MKLLEYKNEIKTKQVYVNIIVGDKIYTKTLSTEKVLEQYGDYTVRDFEAPEITETPEAINVSVVENGITNIIIEN